MFHIIRMHIKNRWDYRIKYLVMREKKNKRKISSGD